MKKILCSTIITLMVLMLFPVMSFANSSYTEWTNTTTLPTESGSYKLTCDVTINKSVTIPKNTTVTLDLNGHTVKVSGTTTYYFVQGSLVIDQTTPNMIQRISEIFERKPLISRGIIAFSKFYVI